MPTPPQMLPDATEARQPGVTLAFGRLNRNHRELGRRHGFGKMTQERSKVTMSALMRALLRSGSRRPNDGYVTMPAFFRRTDHRSSPTQEELCVPDTGHLKDGAQRSS